MTELNTENRKPQKGPLLKEVVEGTPLQIAGREIVPLVRVTAHMRRQAFLRGDEVNGQGYGFVHLRPVALLDKREGEEVCHRIPNGTARAVGWLALAALIVPLLAILLVQLWSRRADGRSRVSSA